MQTHPLQLTTASPATSINIEGRAFRYLNGASAGDTRIIVKPENGNEMELKPGQGFRLATEIGRWFVKSFDGVSAITGTLNIGSGDFEDNNVKLDGAVSISGTPTVNLSAGTKVQEELLAYTGSYAENSNMVTNTAIQILAPGTNVNGLIIQNMMLGQNQGGGVSFIAKASAPANIVDGDVLLTTSIAAADAGSIARDRKGLRVPAGKGLYVISENAVGVKRAMEWTLL